MKKIPIIGATTRPPVHIPKHEIGQTNHKKHTQGNKRCGHLRGHHERQAHQHAAFIPQLNMNKLVAT
jgi:hypothetical protein